jgi:hypothetical protein
MAFRPVAVRSGLILGLVSALVVPLALASTPAGAAPATTTTRSAVASWVPTGPGTPNVSLQVTEQSGPQRSYLFFFVNENYCDTTTDTAVFLSYFASGPETNQMFVVSHSLSTAVLHARDLTVNFTEQTAPECDTNGSDLTTVSSGPVTIALDGHWLATGPAATTFPGEIVRSASAAVSASAPAPLTLAHLGTPAFAQINQYTPTQ